MQNLQTVERESSLDDELKVDEAVLPIINFSKSSFGSQTWVSPFKGLEVLVITISIL